MYKYLTLLLGVAFLTGCCCTKCPLSDGGKTLFKTADGTEYVSAGAISKTWKTDPKVDGTWPKPKPVDTSMYKDATDGVKGVITASTAGAVEKEGVTCLFDNDRNTKYCTPNATPWIQYQFPDGVKPSIVAYSLRTANDASERDPKEWVMQGSNDGKAWTDIDSQKGVEFFGRYTLKLFKLKAAVSYQYYRLVIKANHGGEHFQLSEIELFVNK
ncbi:MAG: discoidin domain-containing protein [Lentisphaeria bacterium]|nr:discoidin domain-containing protein [Victivallales bacterium]MCR4573784.1 discoidin domain-containing protein [Lentisphaeria bacterium]